MALREDELAGTVGEEIRVTQEPVGVTQSAQVSQRTVQEDIVKSPSVAAFSSDPTSEDALNIANTMRYGEDTTTWPTDGEEETWADTVLKEEVEAPLSTPEKMQIEADALTVAGGDTEKARGLVAGILSREGAQILAQQAQQAYVAKKQEVVVQDVINNPAVEDKAGALNHPWLREADTQMNQMVQTMQEDYVSGSTSMLEGQLHAIKQQQMLDKGTREMWESKDMWDLTLDFVGAVLPLTWGNKMRQASEVVRKEGEAGNPMAYLYGPLLAGEAKDDMVTAFRKLSPEEQDASIARIDQFIEQNSGVVGDTNFFLAAEIRDSLLDYGTGDRIVDNTLSVTDAATSGLLSVVTKPIKMVKQMLKSSNATSAAAKMLGKRTESVITQAEAQLGRHGKVADAKTAELIAGKEEEMDLVQDAIQILNTGPKEDAAVDLTAIGSRPKLLENLQKLADNEAAILSDTRSKAIVLTPAERRAAQVGIESALRNTGDSVKVHEFKFTSPKDTKGIAGDSKSVDVSVVYGANEGGFPTYIDALGARKKLGGSQEPFAEVILRDAATGDFHPIDGDVKYADMTTPEFYIKYDKTHEYDVVKDILDEPFFRTGAWMKGTGYFTSWLKDNGNKLNMHIMDMLNVSEDTRFATRGKLRDHAKAFVDLKHESKGRVLNMLEEGSKHVVRNVEGEKVSIGKNYTLDELIHKYPDITDKEVEGYFTARSLMDLTDSIQNTELRRELDRLGYKDYQIGKGGSRHIARPLTQRKPTPSEVHSMLDPVSGKVVEATQELIDDVYVKGGHLARLHSSEVIGSTRVDHMLVRNGKHMKELPPRVLNYREGYIHRFYKEKWFVKTTSPVRYKGSADVHTQTVAAYSTREEALAHKFDSETQARIDSGELTLKEPALDRSAGLTDAGEIEALKSGGRLFTAKRGDQLKGAAMEDKANVEDIMTSMEKDIDSVSYLASHGDIIANLEARFTKEFSDEIDPNTGRLREGASMEAQEAQGILELYKGVPAFSDKVVRSNMIKLSNWLEDKGKLGKYASKVTWNRSGFSLAQVARSATYATFIAMNPGKQILLQGTQFLMLAGAHPIQASKALGQAFAFHTAYLARNSKHADRIEKAASIAAGVSKEEFRAMSAALHESGLLQSLTNHAMLQATDMFRGSRKYETGMARLGQAAGNVAKAPMNVAQKAGFQAGEAHNLTVSWLMVHNIWKEENRGVKWVGNTDIAAEWAAKTRQWTLNANKMGSFKFQRGILATATQFWAFQLKSWLAVTSSQAFTKAERARMFGGLALAWGTGGVFAGGLWDKVAQELDIRIEQDTRDKIEHGLVDYYLNEAATALGGLDASGNKSAIDFSGAMSPLNGAGLIVDAFSKEGTIGGLATGISGYTFSAYINAYKFAAEAWRSPDVSTEEAARTTVTRFLTALPIVGNAQRGIMAHNLLRHISKSTLTPDAQITASEAVMLGVSGFMSRKELAAIELRMQSGEDFRDYQDMGKHLAQHFNDKAFKSLNEYGDIPPKMWFEIEEHFQAVLTDLPHKAREIVRRSFEKYFKGVSVENDAMAQYFDGAFQITPDKDRTMQQMLQDPRLNETQKKDLEVLLDEMYDNNKLMNLLGDK